MMCCVGYQIGFGWSDEQEGWTAGMSRIKKDIINAIKARIRRGDLDTALEIAKRAGITPDEFLKIVEKTKMKEWNK